MLDQPVQQCAAQPIAANLMASSGRWSCTWQVTLGFTDYLPTEDAFFDLFGQLRADRLIP